MKPRYSLIPNEVSSFSSGRRKMNEKFGIGYRLVTNNKKGVKLNRLTP